MLHSIFLYVFVLLAVAFLASCLFFTNPGLFGSFLVSNSTSTASPAKKPAAKKKAKSDSKKNWEKKLKDI